jgi:hypothetical protein
LAFPFKRAALILDGLSEKLEVLQGARQTEKNPAQGWVEAMQ